jgi:hypothetical protein
MKWLHCYLLWHGFIYLTVWFISPKPLNPFNYKPSLSVLCMVRGKPRETALAGVDQTTSTGLSNVWWLDYIKGD